MNKPRYCYLDFVPLDMACWAPGKPRQWRTQAGEFEYWLRHSRGWLIVRKLS